MLSAKKAAFADRLVLNPRTMSDFGIIFHLLSCGSSRPRLVGGILQKCILNRITDTFVELIHVPVYGGRYMWDLKHKENRAEERERENDVSAHFRDPFIGRQKWNEISKSS